MVLEYYFITYAWRRNTMQTWEYESTVINMKPIDWIIKNRQYKNERYAIIFAMPATKEEYDDNS